MWQQIESADAARQARLTSSRPVDPKATKPTCGALLLQDTTRQVCEGERAPEKRLDEIRLRAAYASLAELYIATSGRGV